MVKHTASEVSFHTDTLAEKANSPHKSSKSKEKHDEKHRRTDLVQQKIHVKGMNDTIQLHLSVGHTIDDHAVKFGDLELKNVNKNERQKTD